MNELTCILSAIERGDPRAAGDLIPLVYDELRRPDAARLAREARGGKEYHPRTAAENIVVAITSPE